MSNQNNEKYLQGKELISIGIFSAIYFVLNFICMLLSGIHPVIWILLPCLVSLITGVPFMLMCAKVQKFGAVLLMGLVTALIYYVTGMFTLYLLITFVIACVAAELIRMIGKYGSYNVNTLSFMIFSLGMTGSPLPIWIMKKQFFAQIAKTGLSVVYIDTLRKFSSPGMLAVLFLAPLIGGYIGSLIAGAMFKKHFIKAGMVK